MDRGIVVYSGWSGVEKTAKGHLNVGVGGRAKACGAMAWRGLFGSKKTDVRVGRGQRCGMAARCLISVGVGGRHRQVEHSYHVEGCVWFPRFLCA